MFAFLKRRRATLAQQHPVRRVDPAPGKPRWVTNPKGVRYYPTSKGYYESDDGDILSIIILSSLLNGGQVHQGYEASPEFKPGGGTFGGAGARGGWDPSPPVPAEDTHRRSEAAPDPVVDPVSA